MPSPLTHSLLPTACALSTAQALFSFNRRQWKRLALVCLVLGNAPDLDLIPGILYPSLYHAIHREWGHNIFALGIWITLGVIALRKWVSPVFSGRTGWTASSALVLSHVFLDSCAITVSAKTGNVRGVPLFWPFSNWELVTPWPLFGGYHLVHASHPVFSLFVSPEFWQHVTGPELRFTLCGAALWHLTMKIWTVYRRKRCLVQPGPAELHVLLHEPGRD